MGKFATALEMGNCSYPEKKRLYFNEFVYPEWKNVYPITWGCWPVLYWLVRLLCQELEQITVPADTPNKPRSAQPPSPGLLAQIHPT